MLAMFDVVVDDVEEEEEDDEITLLNVVRKLAYIVPFSAAGAPWTAGLTVC